MSKFAERNAGWLLLIAFLLMLIGEPLVIAAWIRYS